MVSIKPEQNNLIAIDFFCGAGGVTYGFNRAGIKVLAGVDVDESVGKTYSENNGTDFINADITNLPFEYFTEKYGIGKKSDNLIFAGCSPCQYFSKVNTDKAKSIATKYLLDDFLEFIIHYEPRFVFMENVPGFDTNNDSPINRFRNALGQHSYVFSEGNINASRYGVAQNRLRYVLIADRLGDNIHLPRPTVGKPKTVGEEIGDRSKYPSIQAGTRDSSYRMHTASSLSNLNLQRICATPKNGGNRRAWEHDPDLQLNCYKSHEGHYDVYGRMSWDKPAPTITTRFNSYSNGRYGHPEDNRAISLREGASLQSFPVEYKFFVNSVAEATRMIGNAVPPLVSYAIGKSFIASHLGSTATGKNYFW